MESHCDGVSCHGEEERKRPEVSWEERGGGTLIGTGNLGISQTLKICPITVFLVRQNRWDK